MVRRARMNHVGSIRGVQKTRRGKGPIVGEKGETWRQTCRGKVWVVNSPDDDTHRIDGNTGESRKTKKRGHLEEREKKETACRASARETA